MSVSFVKLLARASDVGKRNERRRVGEKFASIFGETFNPRRVQHKFLKCEEKSGMIYFPNIKCIYLDFYAYLMVQTAKPGADEKWQVA